MTLMLGAFERTDWEAGVTNNYRSPRNPVPRLYNYFDLGTKFMHETVESGQQQASPRAPKTIDSFVLTVGGRL